MTATAPLLEVSGLTVHYRAAAAPAVDGVELSVAPGEVVAIVGESGSGKSTTALAAIGLLRVAGARIEGSSRLASPTPDGDGIDLAAAAPGVLRSVHGREVGFIPQDPTVSLDPTQRVGAQVAEALEVHGLARRDDAWRAAVRLLGEAGIAEPERRARQYPHQFSGGMRQRVLIAIAWACEPRLIVADEPTSALDVTVQRQVLDRLDALRREKGTSLLLVTHDLGVAADRADRILVMSEGRIVEQGPAGRVLEAPQAPYTRSLLAASPSARLREAPRTAGSSGVAGTGSGVGSGSGAPATPLVRLAGVSKEYAARSATGARFRFRAVDDVDIDIPRGRTLAVVGESGSGKSTTARIVMGLERPTAGSVVFDGIDLNAVGARRLRETRRRFQLIQQNPFSALSPQWSIERIVTEPLRSFRVGDRASRRARALELLDRVGLAADVALRRPHQLSGGQRQRVAIARALALEPELVVCDEPVSALDVSVQAQILDLLDELQRDLGLTYLFISHDLAVVRGIADEVLVMSRGRVIERGTVDAVFDDPAAEETQRLIAAIPGRKEARR